MINLNIDLGPLVDLNNELKPKLDIALKNAAQSLAAQAHAHILEQVQQKLHSTRQTYADALGFQQVNDTTWVINLDRNALWIEEGMPEHSMIDNLLRSPKAKMAKDGSKYLVVPFQHNKGPTQQTQAATDLTNTIKQELKKRQIPYGKIERDAKGQARTGLLHSFDIMKEPVKTHEGAGMGHGAVGAVRQGSTGIPFLQSVRIYQKNMGGKMQRGIMTFRVASSKHKNTEKWIHPGLEPRRFMDEAADWSLGIWEQMRNEILKEFNQL
jgi:hypothetical protein